MLRGWEPLLRHCSHSRSVKDIEAAQPSSLKCNLVLKLKGQSLPSQALGQHIPDWKNPHRNYLSGNFGLWNTFRASTLTDFSSTISSRISRTKPLLTGKVLKLSFLQVTQQLPDSVRFSVPGDLHLGLKMKFQNSKVLGCAGEDVVSYSGQWQGAVSHVSGASQRFLTWHIATPACAFAPISRFGLGVGTRKIHPLDDITSAAHPDGKSRLLLRALGMSAWKGGSAFPAGTGFCCEKQYEIPMYACCNQSGMFSNTDHHYSYRAWSILGPKWQRNVEYHPFVGWPDSTVMQALKMCVVNQVTKQR